MYTSCILIYIYFTCTRIFITLKYSISDVWMGPDANSPELTTNIQTIHNIFIQYTYFHVRYTRIVFKFVHVFISYVYIAYLICGWAPVIICQRWLKIYKKNPHTYIIHHIYIYIHHFPKMTSNIEAQISHTYIIRTCVDSFCSYMFSHHVYIYHICVLIFSFMHVFTSYENTPYLICGWAPVVFLHR